MMSVDLRFMAPLPFPGLLFHIYHQAGLEEEEAGSHSPLVRHLREFQRRTDTLDTAVAKYSKKIAQLADGIKGDAEDEEDAESQRLTGKLININNMIHDYLDGLLPILREQKEYAKQLDNYLCPPTVELFHKKAESILENAPVQLVPLTKKNTCAVCMEAPADCIITRRCNPPSISSTSTRRPRCEQDTCKCGPTMCKPCLLTHYWTSTLKGSKSYAKCVCCRAEFCLKDVFPVEYEIDAPLNALTPSLSEVIKLLPKDFQEVSHKTPESDPIHQKDSGSEKERESGSSTERDHDTTTRGKKRQSASTDGAVDNTAKKVKRRTKTTPATTTNTTTNTTTTSYVNSSGDNVDKGEDKERGTDSQGTSRSAQERYPLRSSTRSRK